MVILVCPVTHGPHFWYAAQMWCVEGHFMDFLRIKEVRRPHADNVMLDRNTYYFT